MIVSQQQFDSFANWLIEARKEGKERQKKGDIKRLLNRNVYSYDDYDVRKKGDHVESYNKITGEALFEAFDEKEAWRDLRQEFGVT